MRSINVFYHIFIPPNSRYPLWNWWVDQQIQLIIQSKLVDVAEINATITMPKYYNELIPNSGIPFRVNGLQQLIPITFEQKVIEYIEHRYPFVNILGIRDTGEPNIFEGYTLKFLWEKCLVEDTDVLYFHTKGVVSNSPQVACWREILNYFCITEWAKCISNLKKCDLTGVCDLHSKKNKIISGNFWWSKSSYIRQLPDPLLEDTSDRYSFEHWIMKGNPSISWLVDTKTDHHDNYCFLENLKVIK